jgi:hypothetical protein
VAAAPRSCAASRRVSPAGSWCSITRRSPHKGGVEPTRRTTAQKNL